MSANNSTQHITKIDLLKRTIAYDIPMQFPLRTCLCLSHSLSLSFSRFFHSTWHFLVFCIPFFTVIHFGTPAPILDADRANASFVFVSFSLYSRFERHTCVRIEVYCSLSFCCLCLSVAMRTVHVRDAVYSCCVCLCIFIRFLRYMWRICGCTCVCVSKTHEIHPRTSIKGGASAL